MLAHCLCWFILAAAAASRVRIDLQSEWPEDDLLETLELLPAEHVWPFVETGSLSGLDDAERQILQLRRELQVASAALAMRRAVVREQQLAVPDGAEAYVVFDGRVLLTREAVSAAVAPRTRRSGSAAMNSQLLPDERLHPASCTAFCAATVVL